MDSSPARAAVWPDPASNLSHDFSGWWLAESREEKTEETWSVLAWAPADQPEARRTWKKGPQQP